MKYLKYVLLLTLLLSLSLFSINTLAQTTPETCVVFYEDFEDGEIYNNPTWDPKGSQWTVIDGELHIIAVELGGGFYNELQLVTPNYLEISFTGMLKANEDGQLLLALAGVNSNGDKAGWHTIGIRKNLAEFYPDSGDGFILETLHDLDEYDYGVNPTPYIVYGSPEYDEYYHVRAVREDGIWTLYVNGVPVGTAVDQFDMLYTGRIDFVSEFADAIIDNIQVIADCQSEPPSETPSPEPTDEPTATDTPTDEPTATDTPSPEPTDEPSATDTPSPEPTAIGDTVICHMPPGNPDNATTIHVGSQSSVDAHLAHGDTLGECTESSKNSNDNRRGNNANNNFNPNAVATNAKGNGKNK